MSCMDPLLDGNESTEEACVRACVRARVPLPLQGVSHHRTWKDGAALAETCMQEDDIVLAR